MRLFLGQNIYDKAPASTLPCRVRPAFSAFSISVQKLPAIVIGPFRSISLSSQSTVHEFHIRRSFLALAHRFDQHAEYCSIDVRLQWWYGLAMLFSGQIQLLFLIRSPKLMSLRRGACERCVSIGQMRSLFLSIQYSRISQKCSRNGKTLSLSPRKRIPFRTDQSLKPFRK